MRDMKVNHSSRVNTTLKSLIIFLVLSISFASAFVHAEEEYPRLIIVHENGYIVNAGERFSVKVTENTSSGEGVEGVKVFIQNLIGNEYSAITDSNGRAFLTAPEDRKKITIIASKEGYKTGIVDMEVVIPKSLFERVINDQYFLIFLSFLILICVIAYVNLRQRRAIYNRALEISNKKISSKQGALDISSKESSSKKEIDVYGEPKEAIRVKEDPNKKIEEIRIIQPKNEIVRIKTKEDDIVYKKKKSEDWFEGNYEIKYEIDRLTGAIDEEGKDKWFEGTDKIMEKIDEKLKKKNKKDEIRY